jgi:WD40 repeat protein
MRVAGEHLIVTVHGIRTFGQWQERLEDMTNEVGQEDIDFQNYKFGYFSVLAFVIPLFRWFVVRRFQNELIRLSLSRPRSRIDLIGHSFGTHIIAWAIAGLPKESKIFVHSIILSGSVLRAGFPWRDLLGTRVGRVINDCGAKDAVLLLSQFCVLFTGMAGRTGFSGATSRVFRNRYSLFGHSGYFQDSAGNPIDSYMREHWLPLLTSDGPVREFDFRKPSRFEGLVQILGNNAEPIKLTLYIAPFTLLSIWIFGMYVDAKEQKEIAEQQRSLAIKNEQLANEQRLIAEERRREAEERRNQALTTQSRFLANHAQQHNSIGDHSLGMALALEALPKSAAGTERPYVAKAERQLYAAVTGRRSLGTLTGHTGAVTEVAVSQNGSRAITGSEDNTVRLWDLGSGREIRAIGDYRPYRPVVFSPDDSRFAIGFLDNTIRIFDSVNGTQLAVLKGHADFINSIVFSRDGTSIASASYDRTVRIWNSVTGQMIVGMAHNNTVNSVRFSADGSQVLSASDDETARIWNARTGKMIMILKGHQGHVRSAEYSPNEKLIVTASDDATARVWDAVKGHLERTLSDNEEGIQSAVFSPDGSRILTASMYRIARLWDAKSGEVLKTFRHDDNIFPARFSPDGEEVLTISVDGTARIWSDLAPTVVLRGHRGAIFDAKYYSSGARIITASKDRTVMLWQARRTDAWKEFFPVQSTRMAVFLNDERQVLTVSDDNIRIWDVETGRELHSLGAAGDEEKILSAALSSKKDKLLINATNGTIQIWDLKTHQPLSSWKKWTSFAVFSSDGFTVLTADPYWLNSSRPGTAYICNASDGSNVLELKGHTGGILGGLYSPDGTKILTISNDKTARLWNSTSGQIIAVLRGHDRALTAAAFSPDGAHIVTGSEDKTAIVWSAFDGSRLVTLEGHGSAVTSVAFSSDGDRVITGSADKTARIWLRDTGKPTAVLEGHTNRVSHVVFSKDGAIVATTGSDGTARIWRTALEANVATLPALVDVVGTIVFSQDESLVLVAGGVAQIWPVFRNLEQLLDSARALSPPSLTPAQRSEFYLDDSSCREGSIQREC